MADALAKLGVPFQYEPRAAGGLRPDFLVEGAPVVIEYWGGAGWRDYEARMLAKIDRYEAAGYQVVSLFQVHLHELDAVLRRELERCGVRVRSPGG
ncbi:MAG: hypothetical protein ACPGQL_06980 [Thermoplasmatota archaeon]